MYLNKMPMSETGLQLLISQRLSALNMTSRITKQVKDNLALLNKDKKFRDIKLYISALDISCEELDEICRWISNYLQK